MTTSPLDDRRDETGAPDTSFPGLGDTRSLSDSERAEQTTALLASSVLTPTERVALVGDAAALVASWRWAMHAP